MVKIRIGYRNKNAKIYETTTNLNGKKKWNEQELVK